MSESFAFRLRDPNPEMRESALMELVFAPEIEHVEHVLHTVSDKDRDVRRTAMLALGALNQPEVLSGLMTGLLDEDNDVVIAAEHALSKLGRVAEFALLDWLNEEDWLKRRSALQALKHFEIEVASVLPFLKDPIWEVRYALYVLLAQFTDENAIKGLMCAMNEEEHPQARDGILYALGKMQTPEACDVLLQRFFDPQDVDNTDILAQSIEAYGEQVSKPLLKWGLWSPYPHIRALSAALLSQMEHPELVDLLKPLLHDRALEVRETVAYALYQYTTKPFWELLAGLYQESDLIFDAALQAIEELSEPSIQEKTDYLLQVMDLNTKPDRTLRLIESLERAKATPAIQSFVEKIRTTPSLAEAKALIKALGTLEATEAYPDVLNFFREHALQETVALTLSRLAPEEHHWQHFLERKTLNKKQLKQLYTELSHLKIGRTFLIKEALTGESNFYEPALNALVSHQHQFSDFDVSAFLTDYIKKRGQAEESTLDALIQLSAVAKTLSDATFSAVTHWLSLPNENLRRGAIFFLRPHKDAFLTDLLSLTTHEMWFVRQGVLEILGATDHPEIVAAIRKGISDRDRDVRILSVTLLGKLDLPERLDWLVDALENGFREIRAVAARALGRFERHAVVLEPLEIALVEDEALEVRQAAIETLTQLQSPDLLALIEDALAYEDEPTVWLTAIRSLCHDHNDNAYAWALKFLRSPQELTNLQELIPLFGTNQWELEPLQTAIEATVRTQPDLKNSLELQLLPYVCAQNPELARQSLYHEHTQTVAAVISHLPDDILKSERIWIKALWKQKDPYIRRAIYARWSHADELWDDFVALARQEENISLRQTLIEKLDGLPLDKMLPLCESLFVKHTAHTQSPLIWSLAGPLTQGNLSPEALQRIFQVFIRSQDSIRTQVFEMLRAVKSDSALPLLALCIESWDHDLIRQTARILPHWGAEGFVHLKKLWPEAPLATQTEILKGFAHFEDVSSFSTELREILIEALNIHQLQPLALTCFVKFEAEFSVQTLIEAVKQNHRPDDRTLRYHIFSALRSLEPHQTVWKLMQRANSQLSQTRQRALVHLASFLRREKSQPESLKPSQIYELLSYLNDDEAYGVRARFYELNLPPQDRWHKVLVRGLRYDVLPVQLVCVTQLEMIFDTRVKEELLSFWPEARYMLKESVLSVLANHGMPGLSLEALSDSASKVRISAACLSGLYKLKTAEALLIEQVWHDPNDAVRGACCWSLGQLATPKALETLCEIVSSDHFALRYQALRALGNVPEAGDFLTQQLILFRQDRELLFMVLQSLRSLGYAGASQTVQNILNNAQDEELANLCLDVQKAIQRKQQ